MCYLTNVVGIADGHYERYNHKTDMISSGLSLAATMPTQSKRDLIKRYCHQDILFFLEISLICLKNKLPV